MFIDTHGHLTAQYTDSTDEIIQRANNAGVGIIICPTADPGDIPDALNIAQTHDNIFCTIGLHPDCADTVVNADEFLTENILRNKKVVGIGEIGLDYHMGDANKKNQIKLFAEQLDIARKFDLPVAIHTRDAESDTADILKNVRGVMHCYTSSWELARIMLDRGFYFSASGILTFKNAESIRETFAKIPNDRIVIETDAPYCAPVPHRGQICEPAFVIDTARVLADIKQLPLDELETILEQNTSNLYPKIK